MKSLTETYTPLIKKLRDFNQEIRRRHSYMHSSTEQEIENSERWLVEAQAVGKNLGNISLIISHHLDLFEKECQRHRSEAFSKD